MPPQAHENSSLSHADFALFRRFFLEKTGLYYAEARKHQVEIGLNERIKQNGFASYQEYYRFLKWDPKAVQEIQDLIDALTIQETSFFRNKPQFDALKKFVLPEIVKNRSIGIQPLRIWSAGCSTGEEIYSIAMLLCELLPDFESRNITLFATDISRPALEMAERGVYHKKQIRSLPKKYQEKYIKKIGEDYEVSSAIRKMVQFKSHNLAIDSYDRFCTQELDIIFCKNVTIYFNRETTIKITDGFHRKLKQGGFLFLGHSETLWKISNKFKALDFKNTFVYTKENPTDISTHEHCLPIKKRASTISSKKSSVDHSDGKGGEKGFSKNDALEDEAGGSHAVVFKKGCNLSKLKDYENALLCFSGIEENSPYYLKAQIEYATILSNQGKYEDAILLLNDLVQKDSLAEAVYYLLGVLHHRIGDFKNASKMLQKTLYINSENTLASFYLSEVYRQMKRPDLARKTYHNTLKILENLPSDQETSFSSEITPEFLSQACTKWINFLEKT